MAPGFRRPAVGSAVLCCALLAPAHASAAQFEVVATPSNAFSPKELTIASGDAVTWRNTGGFHNVVFDDGSYRNGDPSGLPWTTPPRTFSTPGRFQYYCEVHGGPGGTGMSGTIVVPSAGGAAPPDTQAPAITEFRLKARRGRTIGVTLATSEAGTATVTLARLVRGRYRTLLKLRRGVRAGRTRIRIRRDRRGRRLRAGRYRARARVRDARGNLSAERRATVRLR